MAPTQAPPPPPTGGGGDADLSADEDESSGPLAWSPPPAQSNPAAHSRADAARSGSRGNPADPPAPGVPHGWSQSVAPPPSAERYGDLTHSPFQSVYLDPLSTFSIDVDTAAYSNVRRFLSQGQAPPPEAVRVEEMINYFDYTYPEPDGDMPFKITIDGMRAPWRPEHQLVRVGIQGDRRLGDDRPPANLVFLIDVSGSMSPDNKLPLLKRALTLLTDRLRPDDTVAIVTYAGHSGLALPPTSGADADGIKALVNSLTAGGSTHGSAGIVQAYDVARSAYRPGGVNRVILCTDGDFNVGTTDESELTRLIRDEADSGVFLTVLGFGMGNLNDRTLELLADKGNGHYAYIDTENEARKVLVEELSSTLVTIAKDVKIQVEFNPRHVGAYRLIGYENRRLAPQDFADDTIDAGEIGAGHSVTALYELQPPVYTDAGEPADALRYQSRVGTPSADLADELMVVRLRYKEPEGQMSRMIAQAVAANPGTDLSGDLDFAAAVAGFGMLLSDSPYAGDATPEMVLELARGAAADPYGYRQEFVELVRRAAGLGVLARR